MTEIEIAFAIVGLILGKIVSDLYVIPWYKRWRGYK